MTPNGTTGEGGQQPGLAGRNNQQRTHRLENGPRSTGAWRTTLCVGRQNEESNKRAGGCAGAAGTAGTTTGGRRSAATTDGVGECLCASPESSTRHFCKPPAESQFPCLFRPLVFDARPLHSFGLIVSQPGLSPRLSALSCHRVILTVRYSQVTASLWS